MNRTTLRLVWVLAAALPSATGCSADGGGTDTGMNTGHDSGGRFDGSGGLDGSGGNDVEFSRDIASIEVVTRDVTPNADAFFAHDPPPMTCLADGGRISDDVPLIGTPECPGDRNREGCPCPSDNVGMMAPCWPGLRANRNRGSCHDGMTRCNEFDELSGRWGACEGAVLPVAGARGPAACQCFSTGTWEINNLSPCFVTYGTSTYAVSTYIDGAGTSQCPTNISPTPPPQPQPGQPWSPNRLTVDCTGQFELCYTLRAGNGMAPLATDCIVTRQCTQGWYMTRGVAQTFPPLPAWSAGTAAQSTCAGRFASTGGYGEMSVRGLSGECQNVDDGMGQPFVFNRVSYCPLSCNMTPTTPECMRCRTNGSGMF